MEKLILQIKMLQIQKDNFAYSDFITLLDNSIYMLNNKEIESFKENIFCELKNNNCNISKCNTILSYSNIERFLKICLSKKLSDGIYKYTCLQKTISLYKDVFCSQNSNRKYYDLDFVYKKLLDKLYKKIYPQIDKMICFLSSN